MSQPSTWCGTLRLRDGAEERPPEAQARSEVGGYLGVEGCHVQLPGEEGDAGQAEVCHEALVLALEYSFNGFGAASAEEMLAVLRAARVVRGEVFGAGRQDAGLAATWLVTELLTVSLSAIVNLVDPSALLVPSLEYSFEQHVLVRVGGYVPLGQGLDVALLPGLSGADVLGDSAAWQLATTTLGARSKYGLSPYGAFVQVGLYCPRAISTPELRSRGTRASSARRRRSSALSPSARRSSTCGSEARPRRLHRRSAHQRAPDGGDAKKVNSRLRARNGGPRESVK